MPLVSMDIEPFIFNEVNPDIPGLKLTAKRYSSTDSVSLRTHQSDTVTLIFTHGTGNHKEHWEPTIEKLFSHKGYLPLRIAEAWSFDLQNHGEGGIVNREVLKNRKPGIYPREWARALVSFLNTGILSGRRLIAIGHSHGATALILTTIAFTDAQQPFEAMVLVDPPLVPRQEYLRVNSIEGSPSVLLMKALRKAILQRRDTWPSKEYALKWFGTRLPWKLWDKRVLELYAEYGLKTISSPTNPDTTVATLICSPIEEEANYSETSIEDSFRAYEHLPVLSAKLPVHAIFGERDELLPRYTQDTLVVESGITSATRIPNTGHQVVQEAPSPLADAIAAILKKGNTHIAKL